MPLIIISKYLAYLSIFAGLVFWGFALSSNPSYDDFNRKAKGDLHKHKRFARWVCIASLLLVVSVGWYLWLSGARQNSVEWNYLIGPVGLFGISMLMLGPINGLRSPDMHSAFGHMVMPLWGVITIGSILALLL